MIMKILASKGYSTNMYNGYEGKGEAAFPFYDNLVKTIENTCHRVEKLFNKPETKTAVKETTVTTLEQENSIPNETVLTDMTEKKALQEDEVKNITRNNNITYSLYGKEYTDNQSNMMINVFAKVLMRHPDMVRIILNDSQNPLSRCTSPVDYSKSENRNLNMPAYCKSGYYLDIADGIYVGTTWSYPDKLKFIALLLDLCNEDRSILLSDQIVLPTVKVDAADNGKNFSGGQESYVIDGKRYCGRQSVMMIDIFKYLMEKHFDKRNELSALSCIELTSLSNVSNSVYFRSGEEFSYQGITYSIGTSFSRDAKLKMIVRAASICGEDVSQFEISGIDELYSKRSMRGLKAQRNFLDD